MVTNNRPDDHPTGLRGADADRQTPASAGAGMPALGVALGHVRRAGAQLLAGADRDEDRLLLGLACLDLEDQFAELDVQPDYVGEGLPPAGCLDQAIGLVAAHADEVSLAIWAALRALRARLE